MQAYETTVCGKNIAEESGLEALATRIYETDFDNPMLTQLTDDQDFFGQENGLQEFEDLAIKKAYDGLKTDDEKIMFNRALGIDPKIDSWKRVVGQAEGTLFPIDKIQTFKDAGSEDRLVVSGLVGLQLVKFRSRCCLLAKSRFKEYGFGTFAESCAFVGAYVVGKLIDKDRERLFSKEPSFSYSKDGISHTILVGGTFHGDFTITDMSFMEREVISPANALVEYSPIQDVLVSGYHSTEPDVVEAMLEHTYIHKGEQATTKLVDEFMDIIEPLLEPGGKVNFQAGNFADYGDGDMQSSLIRLKLLTEQGDYKDILANQICLRSAPYLPQSDIMFEIISTPDGIRLQNNSERHSDEPIGIDIDTAHFGNLFASLLSQTQAGLGRTSPHQLIELTMKAKELLG